MMRVMLVDDEALTLELHRHYVERLDGFSVVAEARSARAAIEGYLRDPSAVDLVLLDMTMPDGTGLDVLRHIRARGGAVDVIAITAVRDADAVRQMVSLGAVNYLVKPFTFAMFRERMEGWARYRAQAAQASGAATQAEIDALLGAMRPRAAIDLPKGLSADTLASVSAVVREHGPVSSAEAAALLGVSRVVARRYLEHLVDRGAAVRAARYGSPGRPESEYTWSP